MSTIDGTGSSDGPGSSDVPLGELPTDVLWRMGLDGSILYVSSEVQRVRGLSPEEAKAQMIGQINTPDSVEVVAKYFTQIHEALANGEEPPTFHGIIGYFRADGSRYDCEVRAIPRQGPDGEYEILGVSRGLELD
jgi:PAS domain S-box-containing protein